MSTDPDQEPRPAAGRIRRGLDLEIRTRRARAETLPPDQIALLRTLADALDDFAHWISTSSKAVGYDRMALASLTAQYQATRAQVLSSQAEDTDAVATILAELRAEESDAPGSEPAD
jgi:hypothetical protein